MKSIPCIKSGTKALLYVLSVSTTMLCTLSNTGFAMLAPAVSAPAAVGQADVRATDMKTVQTTLESRIVRERLKSFGMTDKEIDARVSRLSDQQVHQLARDVKTLSPGGGVAGLLELVILVLLIVILLRAV